MSTPTHRTAPDPNQTGMPGGVPFIIGNELAEQFSFYGMKAILLVFMTQHLLNAAGEPAYMNDEEAKSVYHLFTAGAYFFPILGAILSDVLWGKYKTILLISLMYCVGHGMLALMDVGPHLGLWDMKPILYAGLVLIAIGAGGIKPCVSAHVGDQFGTGNKSLLTQVFNWFYFSINLGAFASTLLTPVFLAGIKIGEDPTTGEARYPPSANPAGNRNSQGRT
jgi:POT family proton-dependent oligopeptide transporter